MENMELSIAELKNLILKTKDSDELSILLQTNFSGPENRYVRQLLILEMTGVKYDLKKCTLAKIESIAREMQAATTEATTDEQPIEPADSELANEVEIAEIADEISVVAVEELAEQVEVEEQPVEVNAKPVAAKSTKQNLAYGERYLETGEFANVLEILAYLQANPNAWFKTRKNGELSREVTAKFIFKNSKGKEQKMLFAELKGEICVFVANEYDKVATTPLRMSDDLREFLEAIQQLPANAELRIGKVEPFDYQTAIQAVVFTSQTGDQSSARLAVLEKYYTLQMA